MDIEVSALQDGDCIRVPLDLLVDAPWGNVRKRPRNSEKYAQLCESVADRGVTQAITVRPSKDETTLEVLAGYGRRDASKAACLNDIPVVVKRVCDKEAVAIGLAENLQREDLCVTDEIAISQQYVSLYDGDYEEAARAIGWDVRKVKGRIKLNDCTDEVLSGLAEGKIRLGHAEVLCQFVPKLQEGTLAKILSEQWSVEYLKERAAGANRWLRHAKFDTGDCAGCPHNSSIQASLFDNTVGEGKCGNLTCYREKTDVWLAKHKSEIEEEHGIVLLAIEKPEPDRATVSEDIVGEEAFTGECLGCASRITVMRDGINKDAGELVPNQCIDLVCFQAKKAAHTEKGAEPTQSAKAEPKKNSAAKKPADDKLPSAVKLQAEDHVRTVIGEALQESTVFKLSMTLVALSMLNGYPLADVSAFGVQGKIKAVSDWGEDRIREEIEKAYRHGTQTGSAHNGSFDGTKVALACKGLIEDTQGLVVAKWKPSADWLKGYMKGGIESLCLHVDFVHAWEVANGEGSFKKLMGQKKDVLIKDILAFDFDWSDVAPAEVVALVGEKS